MEKRSSARPSNTAMRSWSDRDLLAKIHKRDPDALGCLYDRYGCLVYRLACSTDPAAAEAITINVFHELWLAGRAVCLPDPLLPTLLRLTAATAARTQTTEGQATYTCFGRPLLPALAPLTQLSGVVFDVLVLSCLGGLAVDEIATALRMDRVAVRQGLSAGLATIRGVPPCEPEKAVSVSATAPMQAVIVA